MLGAKIIALLSLLVVGVIIVVQMTQGENNALHWFALGAILVGLVAVAMSKQKVRQD
jgi:hydrogenase-4 membrane subunit HyfE